MEESIEVMISIIIGRLLQWLATCAVFYFCFAFYYDAYDPMNWETAGQWIAVVVAYFLLPSLDPTDDDC